jgi:D-sedoheptulose 7-phosphate isomerase
VLWELVHVFLEAPRRNDGSDHGDAAEATGGVEALYPFLFGGSQPEAALLDSVAASTIDKVAEVVALRAETGQRLEEQLAAAAGELAAGFIGGATLWSFGNGGSSTDAQQVAHAFAAPPAPDRALPARCLTSDAAILTALSNDVGYDVVFARQVQAYARAGDVVLGLSTSGGSPNVLDGFDAAKALGLTTVGIAGYGGGRMAESASIDYLFDVRSASVHRVQEVQTTIYHVLAELTRIALLPPPPAPG